jgi:hypothetical protein
MDNECGAAYTFLMIGILLIVAAIVWAFLMVGLNPVVDIHNAYVAQGTVSVQSHNLAVWNIAFLLGIPGITMIGIWIFAVNRATEVAQAGNQW